MSQRSQYKRFSREGFQPLTQSHSGEMNHPNDVTINIPMTKVPTSGTTTGARKADATSPARSEPTGDFSDPLSEKPAHFHRGMGRRRRRIEMKGRENTNDDDGSLNAAGRLYMKIYHSSILTRYFVYVAPLAAAIAVPIVVGATVAPHARIGGVKIDWFFTWIEVIWVSLWVSKLVAQFLPYLFQFLCGVVSSGTRKYALILTELEIPLSLVGWALTCLTTFVPLMTLNPDQRARGDTSLKSWESVIKNILFASWFSTLVLLAEKLIIQFLSISYHRKQFDDRIKESKRDIHLVSLLYDASRHLFPMYCREFAEEDYLIIDVLDIAALSSKRDSVAAPGGGHKRSGSATPMRLIQNVARVGDKVTAAFGNVAQEITGKQVFNPTAAHSIVVEALEKKHSAEALARRLWMSFVLEGRDALYPDDIVDVLGSDHEDEAHEAFDRLDVDGNGDISLDEMILRISEFGRERQSIANSMHDVDQAINVLDNLLCTAVLIAVVFIFVAWLNKSFTTTLATAGTALLSMSFVFATSAQEVLGSCIFLFVKHPFDVGDRVDITETGYVVERISLLYTAFRRVKDHKRTQVPNIVLNSLWIDNVSRSKAMREQVLLYVNFDTTFEDIELLKKEMIQFVRDKDNSRDFQRDVDIEVTGLAEMDKMELKIEIRHKSNWANEAVRAARRSKFMCALVLALRKIPIYGPGAGGPAAGDKANPTYSVTITDDEAKRNKDLFDEDKDKKRLGSLHPDLSDEPDPSRGRPRVAKETEDEPGSTSSAETKELSAVENLNRRKVVVDPIEDLALDKKRSNDVDQVRNILRRESTTGRRRAARHSVGLSPQISSDVGAQPIPTIAEPASPPEAHPAPASYVEDSPQPATVSTRLEQGWPNTTPLNYGQAGTSGAVPPRAGGAHMPAMSQIPSPTTPPRYVPGNAFAQQQYAAQQAQRRPVPGIGDMKEFLQGPSQTQSPR